MRCRWLQYFVRRDLAIVDSDFTVDIDDSIAAIMESKKNEIYLLTVLVHLSMEKMQ